MGYSYNPYIVPSNIRYIYLEKVVLLAVFNNFLIIIYLLSRKIYGCESRAEAINKYKREQKSAGLALL